MSKKMTAAELMAKLAADPEYTKGVDEKLRDHESRKELLLKDQEALIADCARAGVRINSVWDLVNTSESYEPAIPILVEHLSKSHQPRTIEGIVRSLTTPAAVTAFDALVRLFKETTDAHSDLKWLLGAAIAETSREESVQTLMELLLDDSHGEGRSFLPLGLLCLPREEALAKLNSLPQSADIDKNVAKAIRLASRSAGAYRKTSEAKNK